MIIIPFPWLLKEQNGGKVEVHNNVEIFFIFIFPLFFLKKTKKYKEKHHELETYNGALAPAKNIS